MRPKAALLATATALVLAGGVVGAAPASAAPDGPNPKSNHGQCTSAPAGLHVGWNIGKHVGWDKQISTERRNVGGTCGPV